MINKKKIFLGDGSTKFFEHYKEMLDADKWQHRCVKATFTLGFGVAVKYTRSSLSIYFIV